MFLLVCCTASTGFVHTEELLEEVDDLEEEAGNAAFVTVAGAVVNFNFTAIFTGITFIIVSFCRNFISVIAVTTFA